jgi:tRNA threonylcarbamoyladenosine biosynthesis protein TsaB
MPPDAILAIETATEQVGVALRSGGRILVREARGMKAPSRLVYTWVAELLAEAGLGPPDLGAVVFGAGPGSFTGVRVATAVAQALGFSRSIPVVPVSTLAALARPALLAGRAPVVLAALDARMGEAYAGAFSLAAGEDGVAAVLPEGLVAPGHPLEVPGNRLFAVGPGFAAWPELLDSLRERLAGVEADRLPDVRDVLALGEAALARGATVPAAEALPNYIRSRVTR